jgi:pimeloyl-ACP methyl ester carboxylesterase
MHYEVHGSGFPLVLIMGLSGNIDWWDPPLIRKLSSRFKTLIFDNRGAGRTDKPEIDYSIRMFADDTVGLMDILGIRRAHVLGISMGGMIAQELVLNYPDRVEKLILCSTNCGGSDSVPPSAQVLGTLLGSRDGLTPEDIVRGTLPLLFTENHIKSNPDLMKLVTNEMLKAPIPVDSFGRQVGAIMNFDVCEKLGMIRKATLVMAGAQDILIPPENSKILAARIPGAKLHMFKNSAHAIFSEETEAVLKALLDFLK